MLPCPCLHILQKNANTTPPQTLHEISFIIHVYIHNIQHTVCALCYSSTCCLVRHIKGHESLATMALKVLLSSQTKGPQEWPLFSLHVGQYQTHLTPKYLFQRVTVFYKISTAYQCICRNAVLKLLVYCLASTQKI